MSTTFEKKVCAAITEHFVNIYLSGCAHALINHRLHLFSEVCRMVPYFRTAVSKLSPEPNGPVRSTEILSCCPSISPSGSGSLYVLPVWSPAKLPKVLLQRPQHFFRNLQSRTNGYQKFLLIKTVALLCLAIGVYSEGNLCCTNCICRCLSLKPS